MQHSEWKISLKKVTRKTYSYMQYEGVPIYSVSCGASCCCCCCCCC